MVDMEAPEISTEVKTKKVRGNKPDMRFQQPFNLDPIILPPTPKADTAPIVSTPEPIQAPAKRFGKGDALMTIKTEGGRFSGRIVRAGPESKHKYEIENLDGERKPIISPRDEDMAKQLYNNEFAKRAEG